MAIALNEQLLKPQAFIDGDWVDAHAGDDDGRRQSSYWRGGRHRRHVGKAETDRTIVRAEAAFKQWRKRTAKERSEVLLRWYELIVKNVDDLAAIRTAEQGKLLVEAKLEVEAAAAFFKWFAEEARRAIRSGGGTPDCAALNRAYILIHTKYSPRHTSPNTDGRDASGIGP